jgi:hypothetical protein
LGSGYRLLIIWIKNDYKVIVSAVTIRCWNRLFRIHMRVSLVVLNLYRDSKILSKRD